MAKRTWVIKLAVVTIVATGSACGLEPPELGPTYTPTPTPTGTPIPTDTASPEPTETPTPEPTDTAEPVEVPVQTDVTPSPSGDHLGPAAMWDPYDDTPGAAAVRDCYVAAAEPLDCVLSAMEDAGAPIEAIDFVEMTGGEAFMVSFQETGRVDLAGVVYPGRVSHHSQYVLLNGTPPIVRVDDEDLDPEIEASLPTSARYSLLTDRFPDATLWIRDNQFEGAQLLPLGRQRFVFSYRLRDGCEACEVLAHAFVGFVFDSKAVFQGVNLLVLVPPDFYGVAQRRFQTDLASLQEGVGSFSYVGRDGNVWILDLDGDRQEPVTQLSEGGVLTYDWSSDYSRLVYVSSRADRSTHIHLLDVGTREHVQLLSDVCYHAFGGMALSPCGERVAFTSDDLVTGNTDIEVLDIGTRSSSTALQVLAMGVGPGIPRTKRGLNWSPDGQYLAADLYASGSVVLSPAEGPEPVIDFLAQLSRDDRSNPTFAPGGTTVAWVDWTTGQEALVLTDIEGAIIGRHAVPACRLGPNTSLAWAPSGRQIAITTKDGLCVVDLGTGTGTDLMPGQPTWNVTWSDDDAWILFQFLEFDTDEAHPGIGTVQQNLGLVTADGSQLIDLGFYGTMPSWIRGGRD